MLNNTKKEEVLKKKIMMYALGLFIGYVISSFAVFYPQDLIRIIGKEPNIDSRIHLTLIHRNSILEGGTIVESHNQNRSKEVLEFLKAYKYRRANISYKKLDNMESYTIKIVNNGKQVFRAAIRGDRYISILNKDEKWLLYKVSGNKFDIKFLENVYKSLSTETN